MSEYKACKDCKHFGEFNSMCHRLRAAITLDPVAGVMRPAPNMSVFDERVVAQPANSGGGTWQHRCGVEAKFFEPK